METELDYRQFIAFDALKFADEENKENGNPGLAVLGIIRAPDEQSALDTATTLFKGKDVFVQSWNTSDQHYIDAAEKMGYLNTSEAHRP